MHADDKESTRHCVRESARETVQSFTQKWGKKERQKHRGGGKRMCSKHRSRGCYDKAEGQRRNVRAYGDIRGWSVSPASDSSESRLITSVVQRRMMTITPMR